MADDESKTIWFRNITSLEDFQLAVQVGVKRRSSQFRVASDIEVEPGIQAECKKWLREYVSMCRYTSVEIYVGGTSGFWFHEEILNLQTIVHVTVLWMNSRESYDVLSYLPLSVRRLRFVHSGYPPHGLDRLINLQALEISQQFNQQRDIVTASALPPKLGYFELYAVFHTERQRLDFIRKLESTSIYATTIFSFSANHTFDVVSVIQTKKLNYRSNLNLDGFLRLGHAVGKNRHINYISIANMEWQDFHAGPHGNEKNRLIHVRQFYANAQDNPSFRVVGFTTDDFSDEGKVILDRMQTAFGKLVESRTVQAAVIRNHPGVQDPIRTIGSYLYKPH